NGQHTASNKCGSEANALPPQEKSLEPARTIHESRAFSEPEKLERSAPPIAEQPQQEEKQVQEIEIERQCADHRDVLLHRSGHCGHLLQLLVIPRRQAEEDEDAD